MTVTLNTLARIQAARSYYSAMEHADADENWLTIERRLNTVVSPYDFSAKGDDQDDTSALLAAVAVCNETGATLDLSRGVFNTSESLVQTAPFFVIGQGGGFFRAARGETVLTAQSRIKWIGAAGGTIWKMQTPEGVERCVGGGMRDVMLDGNATLAGKCLEVSTWASASFYRNSYFNALNDNVYCRVNDYAPSQGTRATQHMYWERCYVGSKDGGASGYGTNEATGFRFTGGDTDGNTSLCTIRSTAVVTSEGICFDFENSDNCTIDDCYARIQWLDRGDKDEIWFRSGEECSFGSGKPARFHHVSNSQLTIRMRAGVAGGESTHSHTFTGMSRANLTALPHVETPAGGSLVPSYTMIESGEGDKRQPGSFAVDGKYVITARKDGWEIPTGTESRETFDPSTVTTEQLAQRVHALIKDLSQFHHGAIGVSAASGTSDATVVAGGEADVMAISFLDDTMVIRDTATPANNYSGAAITNLTVTGSLTASADGAAFDASNHARILTSALPWLDATGTLMVEYEVSEFTEGLEKMLLSVDNGSGDRHEMLATRDNKDRARVRGFDGGAAQYSFTPVQGLDAPTGAIRRLVVTFEASSIIGAWDWIAREGDTSAVMPTPTTLRIGVNRDSTSFADCNIRRVFLAPRKMSIKEAQNLSRVLL